MLNDYINHMKMELYGRGETMIQVGAGSEGEDGDGQSQTFLQNTNIPFFLGTYNMLHITNFPLRFICRRM